MDIQDKAEELLEDAQFVPKWEIVSNFRDFVYTTYLVDLSDEECEKYLQDIYDKGA